MFSDGVPEIRLGKDSALDSCPVCLAANMKSRNRGDGETRAATKPGQGLSLDFLFAGQHLKNATNPEQMRINDYRNAGSSKREVCRTSRQEARVVHNDSSSRTQAK